MMIVDGEKFFTLKEVAEEAGKSQQTIKRWGEQGKTPKAKKIESSGRLVFTESDKDEIVKFAKSIRPI